MQGRKHLLHSLHHLLTGITLLLKGIDKLSHHPFIGGIILVMGVLLLSFFAYTQVKKHWANNLELMVRWFEALSCLFVAYVFFTEGKRLLSFVYLVAAAGFFISIYIFHRKKKLSVSK